MFITVSNSTAHLAGALGVKTLLVKPINHASYHYWNYPDYKTPWYNNVMMINKKMNEAKGLAKTFVRTPNGLKVVNPEGYVAIDHTGGAVKIVDKLEFSFNNFTVAKNWDK